MISSKQAQSSRQPVILDLEHLGSAHGDAEMEAAKAAARQRIAAGQLEFGLDLEPRAGKPPPFTSSRMLI